VIAFITGLSLLSLQDAHTLPARSSAWSARSGFALLRIDVPSIPVVPVLTGGVAAERGLTDAVDLGIRYQTDLGYNHLLGPELQIRALKGGNWAAGFHTMAFVRIAGTTEEGLSLGGEASTLASAVVGWRGPRSGLVVGAGPNLQWLLFERLDGEGFVDALPWLASVDFSVEYAWATPWAKALSVRLEAAIPRAPDDPFRVLGAHPRVLFGGHFGGRSLDQEQAQAGYPDDDRQAEQHQDQERNDRANHVEDGALEDR